jgi:hypothetical protein
MATFKEIKQKFSGNKPTKIKNPIESQSEDNNLELTEARYLLALIAKSDFSGKDIQIVYNVAFKLQKIIENILNTEDVKSNG